ncbi:unnamed protein product [Rotaria sp. Silwood2]|nr:unnamed protein product [Rotaria sp. Silwood2]
MSSIQSSDTTQTESVYNPERNEELGGDDMVHPPFAIPPAGRGVAIRSVYQRWAHGVVPYEFASNITVNDSIFIVKMMRAMENLTQVNNTQCISFRPRDTSDLYYITIFNGSGCYAPVGSWGNYIGNRPVSFMHGRYSTCMVSGIIQHELTHVLGFYHEQSRPDRDSYVSIQWSNIQPANVFNFDKYNYSQVDTLMTSYDYGSVMHYERNAFAINDMQLSPIDILEIQRYYGCVSTPADVSITTVTSTTTSTKSTTTTAMTTASVTTTKETTTNETTNETTTNKITTNEATTNTSIRNAFRSYFEIYVICFTSIIYFSN